MAGQWRFKKSLINSLEMVKRPAEGVGGAREEAIVCVGLHYGQWWLLVTTLSYSFNISCPVFIDRRTLSFMFVHLHMCEVCIVLMILFFVETRKPKKEFAEHQSQNNRDNFM